MATIIPYSILYDAKLGIMLFFDRDTGVLMNVPLGRRKCFHHTFYKKNQPFLTDLQFHEPYTRVRYVPLETSCKVYHLSESQLLGIGLKPVFYWKMSRLWWWNLCHVLLWWYTTGLVIPRRCLCQMRTIHSVSCVTAPYGIPWLNPVLMWDSSSCRTYR